MMLFKAGGGGLASLYGLAVCRTSEECKKRFAEKVDIFFSFLKKSFYLFLNGQDMVHIFGVKCRFELSNEIEIYKKNTSEN